MYYGPQEAHLKQLYRITVWKLGKSERTLYEKKFKGKSLKECDEKAKGFFEALHRRKSKIWPGMSLVRIDVPAVSEQITNLGCHNPPEEYSPLD